MPLTLEAIAEWPIITYHEGFTGRGTSDERFASAGLRRTSSWRRSTPMSSRPMSSSAWASASWPRWPSPGADKPLRLLDCSHLFDEQTSRIAVRRGRYLRGFAYRFIELCAPDLTEDVVKKGAAAEA